MLLSNISVAQHIAVHLPEQALLRRHDIPMERRLVCTHYLYVTYFHAIFVDRIHGAGGASWV